MQEQDPLHADDINQVKIRRFSEMTGIEKVKFVGKVVVFIITGGFAFPTLFSD